MAIWLCPANFDGAEEKDIGIWTASLNNSRWFSYAVIRRLASLASLRHFCHIESESHSKRHTFSSFRHELRVTFWEFGNFGGDANRRREPS